MLLHLRKFKNAAFELLKLTSCKCGAVVFIWKDLKHSSPIARPCEHVLAQELQLAPEFRSAQKAGRRGMRNISLRD